MDLLPILEPLLAQPTAPFREDAVAAEIRRQLADCPHVTVQADDFGNLIAEYRKGDAIPRFAFAAHMDHPGYVGTDFLGGVPEEYRQNGTIRQFDDFSMWDLPPFELREGRIYSRACDDLVGCAAIVGMLKELANRDATAACYGLFTRGEEVGFVGAIHLARSGRVPMETTVISLETSSERGGPGRMGEGVIIRVGDRTSIFDSAATATLTGVARASGIPFQRCLMSGGTCEATAYQLYGYRTAGLCVALGNYHNCGPANQIASEFVSLADSNGMAALCVAAATLQDIPDLHASLRARLEAEAETYRPYWERPGIV